MIVTVYSKRVKRRATGIVETVGCAYETKAETPAHARIRSMYPDAQTWRDPKRVITNLIGNTNLGMRPIVTGGERIA